MKKKQKKDKKEEFLESMEIRKKTNDVGIIRRLFILIKEYLFGIKDLPWDKMSKEGFFLIISMAIFMITLFLVFVKK